MDEYNTDLLTTQSEEQCDRKIMETFEREF
jgi:hypothetical protein